MTAWPAPARAGTSTRGAAGGSYASIRRSASAQANTSSTARHHNALEGVQAGHGQTALPGGLLGDLRQLLEVQIEARKRPRQVGTTRAHLGVQCVGVLDVLFPEVVFVLGDVDVQPLVGDNSAFVERVLVGMRERDEFVVLLKIGELERRPPASPWRPTPPAPTSGPPPCEASSLLGRNLVEAAHGGRNRVDLAASHQAHQRVADLLQTERLTRPPARDPRPSR